MRADPPVSVRQARLEAASPTVTTLRQSRLVTLSESMRRGFKNNATRIAKRQGIPYERAAAILAAAARKASPAARRKNPRLKRVKGKADKT